MADFNAIAQQFVDFYYKAFDSDRGSLGSLYRDTSMLTFEAQPFQGAASIVEKLASLPFEKVQHRVDTTDAQPSPVGNGIVVMVTGALMVDEQPQPMNYTQAFQLIQDGDSYFIQNDLFRLVYSAS